MNKKDVIELISNLKYGDFSEQSFETLVQYLQSGSLDSKWHRRILRLVSRAYFPHKDKLMRVLNREKSDFFNFFSYRLISSKEIYEAEQFNDQVRSVLPGAYSVVYDLCCGNGLNGFNWLYGKQTSHVHFYDIIKSSAFLKSSKGFKDYTFHQESISDLVITEKDCLVIGVHACGGLTDTIIDLALENRLPFAVMPCCSNSSDPYLDRFSNPFEAVNYHRIKRVQEEGYHVELREIDKSITEKNLLIVGEPV